MKYGYKGKGIGLLFFILILLMAFNESWAIKADDARAIAQMDMDTFMGSLMLEYLKEHGLPKQNRGQTFGSLDEVGSAAEDGHSRDNVSIRIKLKAPFQVHAIDPDAALDETGENLLESLIPLDEWIVPLTFNGQEVGRLTVGMIEDEWQVIEGDIGEFAKRMKHVPVSAAPGKGLGKYVRVDAACLDFVIATHRGVPRIFLPPDPENELEIDPSLRGPDGLYNARDVMPAIVQRIHSAFNGHSGLEGGME